MHLSILVSPADEDGQQGIKVTLVKSETDTDNNLRLLHEIFNQSLDSLDSRPLRQGAMNYSDPFLEGDEIYQQGSVGISFRLNEVIEPGFIQTNAAFLLHNLAQYFEMPVYNTHLEYDDWLSSGDFAEGEIFSQRQQPLNQIPTLIGDCYRDTRPGNRLYIPAELEDVSEFNRELAGYLDDKDLASLMQTDNTSLRIFNDPLIWKDRLARKLNMCQQKALDQVQVNFKEIYFKVTSCFSLFPYPNQGGESPPNLLTTPLHFYLMDSKDHPNEINPECIPKENSESILACLLLSGNLEKTQRLYRIPQVIPPRLMCAISASKSTELWDYIVTKDVRTDDNHHASLLIFGSAYLQHYVEQAHKEYFNQEKDIRDEYVYFPGNV